MLISVNNTIKCTIKFTFNLIILWYFGTPKWNKCDEIEYTLYNFYNNFLETLQSLFCITKLKYFLYSSSSSYLLISSSILEEKLSLSVLEVDEHNDFIHFSQNSLNVPLLAFSHIKTSITVYFSIVNTSFTNLCNTSKSHFKLHATNSGNIVNIFYVFQSHLDLR